MTEKQWDVFISHASEDKDDFVRPLAQALAQLGVRVWYDEFSLQVGDSLSRSIDAGLANSSFGVVVISPSFVQKKWPERELRGLVQREILTEEKLILPIWLGISHQEVMCFSPTLSDAYALRASDMNAEEIALTLLKTLRPDIYRKHSRIELTRMLRGDALRELQREVEARQFQTFARISAALSHDLRNAIEGMSLTVSNLEHHFANEQFRKDTMRGLSHAIDKIRLAVTNLTYVSDKTVLWQPRPIDLCALITSVLSNRTMNSIHEIELRLPPSLTLLGDEVLLEKVVDSLIINALESMQPKKGRLKIEAGMREGELFFSVTDTGIGMSQEFIQTSLFRPFTTTKKNGVGLSLYVSRNAITAHGGRFEVKSEEGVGTSFCVVFRASSEAQ